MFINIKLDEDKSEVDKWDIEIDELMKYEYINDLQIADVIVWKGRRVYEAKRTAHWCVEACNCSYLTALTGGGPYVKEQMVISCLMSEDARRYKKEYP